MADFQATPSQAAAIGLRNCSLLISAGAGSGKTKVLTERLIDYLQPKDPKAVPENIDRFLIITFTKAAAGELKSRIGTAIAEELEKDPANTHLRRQSMLCRNAEIGTIHSFCARILREHAAQAGISPAFRSLEEERGEMMRVSALERVLERHYEKRMDDPDFLALADSIGAGRNDSRLAEMILKLHRDMQSQERPRQWAEKQKEILLREKADVAETVWGSVILHFAGEKVRYWAQEMENAAAEICAMEPAPRSYAESFPVTAAALRRLESSLQRSWDEAQACFPIPFPGLTAVRNNPDPELTERVKALRQRCKKDIEELQKQFYAPSGQLLKELRKTAPAMGRLLDLALELDEEFRVVKRRGEYLDYSDLEHYAVQLLTDSEGNRTETAAAIAQRYREIMVDEYQDVSRVQDAIFRAVSQDGKNLFFVGDVKQAIYRFRLADPAIFTEKYDAYTPYPSEDTSSSAYRVCLQENFRSRREILNAANAVFSCCMSRDLGGIEYDEAASLRYGSKAYTGNVPNPELLLIKTKDEAGEKIKNPTEWEAEVAGRKILSLMEAKIPVTDDGAQRPLRYSDIAILLRSANQTGPIWCRVLRSLGIPVTEGQGGEFFQSTEIVMVRSMLRLIDNPHQDIPLLALLRSPAFCFTPDELTAVRMADLGSDLYDALQIYANTDEKAARFLSLLKKNRHIAPDLRPAELITQVIGDLDLYVLSSAFSDGAQRRHRLTDLIAMAERFTEGGSFGLHRFLSWLDQNEKRGLEPVAGGEGGNAVQILTIHRSKGLEYPVVFYSSLGKRFNLTDGSGRVLLHPTLGLGPKVLDEERKVEYPTIAHHAIRQQLKRDTLSEEMRLSYVAVTRARERLFLTGTLDNPEKKIEEAGKVLQDPMPADLLLQASTPLDWMLYAALADRGETLDWKIVYPEAVTEKQKVKTTEEVGIESEDSIDTSKLEQKLSFVYPYGSDVDLPSKLTATGLKELGAEDADGKELLPDPAVERFRMPEIRPVSAGKKHTVSAARRGTAAHLVLEHLNFEKTGSEQDLAEEIRRLVEKHFLTQEEADSVNRQDLLRLFRSPLGVRMRNAEKCRREFRFSLLCNACEFYPEREKKADDEKILLQGVIDCCLEEDDGIVLIDYKTDRVTKGRETAERAQYYLPQLEAYTKALIRIFAKPVKERLLVFLDNGEIVSV